MFNLILAILFIVAVFLIASTIGLLADIYEAKEIHNTCQQENDCEFCKYYRICYNTRKGVNE